MVRSGGEVDTLWFAALKKNHVNTMGRASRRIEDGWSEAHHLMDVFDRIYCVGISTPPDLGMHASSTSFRWSQGPNPKVKKKHYVGVRQKQKKSEGLRTNVL